MTKRKRKESNKDKKVDKTDEITSLSTDDTNMAVEAYKKGGASLYLGASAEFRETWSKRLACHLGMNFSAYFPNFTSRSEIEIFAS